MTDTNLNDQPAPTATPDRSWWGIGGLALSALALGAIYLAPVTTVTPAPPTAAANQVTNAGDYQLATAEVPGVGDALYILNSRFGMMAVLTWDPASRTVKVRNVQAVEKAFQ